MPFTHTMTNTSYMSIILWACF